MDVGAATTYRTLAAVARAPAHTEAGMVHHAARMLLQAAARRRALRGRAVVGRNSSERASIVGWVANYRVGSFVVDVAFPQKRVVIEVDGWAFHSDVYGVPARPGQAELPGPARLAGAAVHLAGPRRRSRPRRCRDPGGLRCSSRAERGSNTTNHSRVTTRCRMPVCRLLRVHSTGRPLGGREPRQQLLEEDPHLQPREPGAEAVVHALTETQVRVGLTRMSKVLGSANTT